MGYLTYITTLSQFRCKTSFLEAKIIIRLDFREKNLFESEKIR